MLLGILVAMTLSLGACGKKAAGPTSTGGSEGVSAATTEGDAGKVGITECDDYVAKYAACITSKIPEASQGALKSALDQSVAQWKQSIAGANDEAKAAVGQGCKAASDAAKQSMAAYGCEW